MEKCTAVPKDRVMKLVFLFLSHSCPKNTIPWNKWAVILCHCVSQHEIIEECNYHFVQQSFALKCEQITNNIGG